MVFLSLVLLLLAGAGYLFTFKRKLVDHAGHSAVIEKPAARPEAPTANAWSSFDTHGKVAGARFSPDGKLLAVVVNDKSVYFLDVATGLVAQRLEEPCCAIEGVGFSGDSRTLALAMNDGDGVRITLISMLDGKFQTQVQEIRQQGSLVHSVEFSGDGKYLLSMIDSDAVLWKVGAGAIEKRFDVGVNGICSMGTNGATIVSGGSNESEVKIWDVASGDVRLILSGHKEGLLSVAIASDGVTAVSGGYDATARIWDLPTGALKAVLKHGADDAIRAMAFSHSASNLATAGDSVRIWNLATNSVDQIFAANHVTSLAYSRDDRLLAGTDSNGKLMLWHLNLTSIQAGL